MSDESNKVILRKLSDMLSSEAWKLLDKHWEAQQNHNQIQALTLNLPAEDRLKAVAAYNAIKAMRNYPTALGYALHPSGLHEE